MTAKKRAREPQFVLISVVAETYGIHPQTLRLYERHGLIKPARSAGNTRLYDQTAIRRLEQILILTRDLGVNLAGVEVVLQLRERIEEMESELDRLVELVRRTELDQRHGVDRQRALVPTGPRALVRR
ncbi:MAG TPA: chaperone modulator CbpM [Thermoanaerobaculia bacterium]|nr:chaperone modulator CbpM [Thermoanaerobaculia bacterium]